MAIVSWLALAWMVIWVEPNYVANILWKESYLPFYSLFWWGWFWLLTAMSGRWKRSLLWASSLTCWLWLRSMQLDTLWTIGLLLAFNLVWAYYWKISKA
jgi:hypothetical protein